MSSDDRGVTTPNEWMANGAHRRVGIDRLQEKRRRGRDVPPRSTLAGTQKYPRNSDLARVEAGWGLRVR